MTVQAELQFVTDAASEANKAADAVARLTSALQQLQGASGSESSFGPNASAINAQTANVVALQVQGANQVAAIRANAVAAEAASQHRIAEQYQKDRNAILVSGAAASHAMQASELAHAHNIAEIEKKGATDAQKLRIKGEQDRATIAAKNAAEIAKTEAKRRADEEKDARRLAQKKAAKSPKTTNAFEEMTTSGFGGAAKAILERKGVGGALGAFGGTPAKFAAIAELAVDAADAVADLTVKFGEAVVKAQSYKEDIKEAFITVRQTNQAADATFQTAIRNADKLGFARAESVGMFLDLATKGFDDAKIKEIQGRLLDITTIDPRASVEQLTKIIGQVKATGRLNQETLSMLATAGLEQADVIKVIGKALNKSDKDVLRALSSGGGIRDERNVDFILQAITGQTGGGEAGVKFAEKSNRNLSSLLKRIEEIPQNVLFDVEVGPGIDSIKDTLKQILAYFDVGSDTGQRVRKVVGDIFNALSQGLFGKREGDEKGVTGTLNNIVAIGERAVPVVLEVSSAIGSLTRAMIALGSGDTTGLDASTKRVVGVINIITSIQSAAFSLFTGTMPHLGDFIQPLLDITGIDADATKVAGVVNGILDMLSPRYWITSIYSSFNGEGFMKDNPIIQMIDGWVASIVPEPIGSSIGSSLTNALSTAATTAITGAYSLGADIISGLVGGIQSGLSKVASMATTMGDTVISSVRGALDSHSPARELISVGLDSAIGLAIGGRRGTPMVAGAFSSMAMAGLMAAAAVPPLPMSMPIGLAGPSALSFASQSNQPMPQFTFAPVIQVSVGNNADANEVASAIEDRIRRMIPDAITAYLETLGGRR